MGPLMKLRHAATLALVGWYLFVPPINKGSADFKVPLTSWTKVGGSFDSASACRKGLSDHKHLTDMLGGSGYARSTLLQDEEIRHAQCAADYDPHLQGWKGGYIGAVR